MKKKGTYSKRVGVNNEKIIELYVKEGWTASRIATEFDVAPSTVRWRLMQAGVYAGDTRKIREYNTKKKTAVEEARINEEVAEIMQEVPVEKPVAKMSDDELRQRIAMSKKLAAEKMEQMQ